MQLTNETALPVAWIEAEDDNWGCDEEDCEVGILIDLFTHQGENFKVCSSKSFRHVFRFYYYSFLRQTDNCTGMGIQTYSD